MVQVVNHTRTAVEVYGIDTTSGVPKRWVLGPHRQTAATFDCQQVRTVPGGGDELFASAGWWEVRTRYAVLYTADTGFLWDNLTLHCVPFLPADANGTTWQRGYDRAAADPDCPICGENAPEIPDSELGKFPDYELFCAG